MACVSVLALLCDDTQIPLYRIRPTTTEPRMQSIDVQVMTYQD
jgi:hypothetical protein